MVVWFVCLFGRDIVRVTKESGKAEGTEGRKRPRPPEPVRCVVTPPVACASQRGPSHPLCTSAAELHNLTKESLPSGGARSAAHSAL
eukprot:1473976-Prymnesium_polylepis.1